MIKECPHGMESPEHCPECISDKIDALYERARERVDLGRQDDFETISASFMNMMGSNDER